MFESSVVESVVGKQEKRRYLMLPVSIAVHGLAIAGFVTATVWNVSMPQRSPDQMKTFVFEQTPVVPAPQPQVHRAPAPAPQQQSATPHVPLPPAPLVTPTIIPDQVPMTTATSGPTTFTGTYDPNYTGPYDWSGNGDNTSTGTDSVGNAPLPAGVNDVKAPVIIQRASPEYPELARRMHLQGKVVVECIIDRQGNLTNINVVESDHEIFNSSAVEAVKKWRFLPGTLRGNPVATIFRLSVTFRLN